jgi:hypothetical protein
MSKTLTKQGRLAAPVDRVLALLTDPAFVERRHLAQGAVAVTVTERERTADRLVQAAELTEHARTRTGGVDRTRTEPATTTYTWDLRARRCAWQYLGPQRDYIRLGGTIRLEPAGDGTLLHAGFEVAVSVPLIGRVIEGVILKEIDGFEPTYLALVREGLA